MPWLTRRSRPYETSDVCVLIGAGVPAIYKALTAKHNSDAPLASLAAAAGFATGDLALRSLVIDLSGAGQGGRGDGAA